MDVVRSFVRGAVTVHVLHHAAETPVHGAWMARELARHGYAIGPGTLYPLLHRLEDAGLVVSRSEVVDGRVRRRYAATTEGRMALERLRRAVAALAEEVLDASAGDLPGRRTCRSAATGAGANPVHSSASSASRPTG